MKTLTHFILSAALLAAAPCKAETLDVLEWNEIGSGVLFKTQDVERTSFLAPRTETIISCEGASGRPDRVLCRIDLKQKVIDWNSMDPSETALYQFAPEEECELRMNETDSEALREIKKSARAIIRARRFTPASNEAVLCRYEANFKGDPSRTERLIAELVAQSGPNGAIRSPFQLTLVKHTPVGRALLEVIRSQGLLKEETEVDSDYADFILGVTSGSVPEIRSWIEGVSRTDVLRFAKNTRRLLFAERPGSSPVYRPSGHSETRISTFTSTEIRL